jgi:hypothetical protein
MIKNIDPQFYIDLTTKKKKWIPIQPTTKQLVCEGARPTLERALSLSKLELPVGNWITEELSKNKTLSPSIIKLLEINVTEESNHDLALNNIRAVFPVPVEFDTQVDEFITRANQLSELYSPLTVAAVLESSIFFVILPMFRFLGSPAMRTTANDISNDENIHVSTNVQLALDLGYRRGKALDTFRKDIVDFLVADLTDNNANKYLNKDFWHKSSYSLYHNSKTDMLAATKHAVMPCFFESPNTDLPTYG